ncbi:rRNA maturation RNase YbeY [Alkalibacter mobilis]|uniref:rRNA maturation RNase YbeY n=1 Tax=Alkalibacter mobilis TaxID=2787712 RepID=UPI00189CDE4B|nr:rRNA maturation RNase YbeY [Alkalibacter mobilis]MBF7096856.1 rRNA maturation RNase YbeY [Alkalibacter mobilis]
MEIFIDNRTDETIDDELVDLINKTVEAAIKIEKFTFDYEVAISIVAEEEIKKLNRDYRSKDSVTDVLSFPMYEEGDIEPVQLGDIIICFKRAVEQSEEYGHDFRREISYLTAHGMLHLLGYDHMQEDDKRVMRSKEKEIMDILELKR